MRTALLPRPSILLANGQPWQPTAAQMAQLQGHAPYKGADTQRGAGRLWGPTTLSADAALLPWLDGLRARSQDLERSNALASGAIQTICDNVIGPGLQCRPAPDRDLLRLGDAEADAMSALLGSIWLSYANGQDCDLARHRRFSSLQQLALRAALIDGDLLVSLPVQARAGVPWQTCVQLTEAARVSNPQFLANSGRLVAGVETDAAGVPQRYHVQRQHPSEQWLRPRADGLQWDAVNAWGKETNRRTAWLLARYKRLGQTRGEPYFAVVLEPLKQIDRYTDAELAASIIGGSFTVFIKTPTGEGLAPLASLPVGPGPGSGQAMVDDIALDYGAMVQLAAGESIDIANPNRPNRVFGDFVRSVLQVTAVGLNLPFELLIKHFTTSYSASRAALLEAWKFFRVLREWFAMEFCQPIYEAVLWEAWLRGFLPLAGFDNPLLRQAYCYASWIGPAPGQLSPLDEANAAEVRLKTGLSSLARETTEITGEDWEDVHAQRRREVERRRRDGLEPDPQPSQAKPPEPAPLDQPDIHRSWEHPHA
jgi:lambda family phage portal protein